MKTNRYCPACLSRSGGVLAIIKMETPEEMKLPKEYNIVCCDKCGNCYADTSGSAEDYNDYYKNQNYYGGGWKYNSSTEFDFIVITRMLGKIFDRSVSLADIGCGGGALLRHLNKHGFENVIGIDPSADSIKSLHEYGIKGAIGSVYESTEDGIGRLDVVIMTMVLEHLLEPDRAIINIRDNYLKDDGYMIVTWPYFEDMILDNTPMFNNFNHEHINYFSVQTADWLFDRCGFVRVENHVSVGYNHDDMIILSNVALYRRKNCEESNVTLKPDIRTGKSITEYVDRVKWGEDSLIHNIRELVANQEEVVIWGTGAFLMHLMAVSPLGECNIIFIVDNNRLKQGSQIYGYDVKSPESLKDFKGSVIITAMLYGNSIEKQIREMGNTECHILYPKCVQD